MKGWIIMKNKKTLQERARLMAIKANMAKYGLKWAILNQQTKKLNKKVAQLEKMIEKYENDAKRTDIGRISEFQLKNHLAQIDGWLDEIEAMLTKVEYKKIDTLCTMSTLNQAASETVEECNVEIVEVEAS